MNIAQRTVLIIGYGSRATTYTTYLIENPSRYRVIAVAEPNEDRRKNCQTRFGIVDEYCYTSWEQALETKIADLVFITTLDHQHIQPTLRACQLKYDIVLEKPMGINLDECMQIYEASKEHNTKITLCHVMRYHPFYQKAKEIIASGQLGKILQVQWLQPINWLHFVKSYVRHPTWSKNKYGPLPLTKGVHCLDLLYWMLDANDAKVISSVGDKAWFVAENQPEGASDRCTDCKYKYTCGASAVQNYAKFEQYRNYVTNVKHPTEEDVLRDLEDSPYNQCAWKTSADVHERITTIIKMYTQCGSVDVNYIMSAMHDDICYRTATLIGTKGRLDLCEKDSILKITPIMRGDGTISTPKTLYVNPSVPNNSTMTGHSGADYHFADGVFNDNCQTFLEDSMASHVIALDIGDSLTNAFRWKPKKISRIFNKVKVLVTTEDKEKLQGVVNAFECLGYYPLVTGLPTESGVLDGQSYGLNVTSPATAAKIVEMGWYYG